MISVFLVTCLCMCSSVSPLIVKRQANGRPGGSNLPTSVALTAENKIVNAIQELALDISAAQWEQRLSENVVQSPLSISSLLSLLLLASRGNSYVELKRALGYPNDMSDTAVHETFEKILGSVERGDGVEVSINSRLFVQQGLSILGEFTRMAEKSYFSTVRTLNFAGAPTSSRNTVNNWIAQSTNGKITDLISSPFSPDTKFVATNAIYFNGEWENPFSNLTTKIGAFDTGSRNVSIPMMISLMTVPYLNGDQLGFDMISLPYKGRKYSMYILTPRGKPGIQSIQSLEYQLNAKVINELISRMKPARVAVQIPKMKLQHKIHLKNELQSLDVHDIFDAKKADFGRLLSEPGIFVNDIVHEAVIEITETGTVAAAASASVFDRIGGQDTFKMNKPSLLFIRDNTNGLVLFWARVMKPEPVSK